MWLFSKYGFFSAVVINGVFVVRTRERKHLVALKERFKLRQRILVTPHADYPYRIRVERKVWARVCRELALDVDYSNFKDAAKRTFGRTVYVSVLHDVWTCLWRAGRGFRPRVRTPKGRQLDFLKELPYNFEREAL